MTGVQTCALPISRRRPRKPFVHRIARHIAGHAASLHRLDGVVFTGGIGENSKLIRQLVTDRLKVFGITLDEQRNAQPGSTGERIISADTSRVPCAVIPTNEEKMIALTARRQFSRVRRHQIAAIKIILHQPFPAE